MKKMKFSMKALMAMLLFCLPLAMTSCGSDDDGDNSGPKKYEYSWTLDDASSGSTTAEQQANLAEQAQVNAKLAQVIVNSGTGNGVLANATTQTFSFTGTKSADEYDNMVKSAFYSFKSQIMSMTFNNLPSSTKVTIKRGGTKVVSEKIFN